MRWVGGIALAAGVLSGASCINVASHTCGQVAYSCEQTLITLQSPNDAWTAGTYTLAMTMDGTPAQCSIQIPDPPPAGGVQGSCAVGSNVTLGLVAVESCPPVVCANGACEGTSCTPVAGRFQMVLATGTSFGLEGDAQPHVVEQLALDLSLDGNELMNETIAPTSTTTEPNGAGCGTCTNASATVSIAGG
jgi:hypothetical protein